MFQKITGAIAIFGVGATITLSIFDHWTAVPVLVATVLAAIPTLIED